MERRIDEILVNLRRSRSLNSWKGGLMKFVNLRRGRSFDFSAAHPIKNVVHPGTGGV